MQASNSYKIQGIISCTLKGQFYVDCDRKELMKIFAKKILGAVLSMAVLLISSHGLAQEQYKGDQTSGAKQETLVSPPDLADIVPSAAELTGRLAALENRTKGGLDIPWTYPGVEIATCFDVVFKFSTPHRMVRLRSSL
jgi:hypothetical protein